MKVFVISDLHLPGGEAKPMDVFGAHWTNHYEKITADWRARVQPDDLVLLPGDTCWAMRLDAALEDLHAIGALAGRKVLLRGNHDYWWSSISRVRAALPEGMYALQNDALTFGDVIVCGTRGWTCPDAAAFVEETDGPIYARELGRLRLSLEKAAALRGESDARVVAMLHYPPVSERAQATEVTALLSAYGVHDAVYGHLHGPALAAAYEGELDGVRYHLTTCDGLGFKLYQLY